MVPLGGFLINRFGPRPLTVVSSLIMAAGLVMFALITHLWQFYLSSDTRALGQGLGQIRRT